MGQVSNDEAKARCEHDPQPRFHLVRLYSRDGSAPWAQDYLDGHIEREMVRGENSDRVHSMNPKLGRAWLIRR